MGLDRKETNEIELSLEIGNDDLHKDIYFLDGESHENLKELDQNNTELYIYTNIHNKISNDFQKNWQFEFTGNYQILLKFKNKLTDSSYMFYKCIKLNNILYFQ